MWKSIAKSWFSTEFSTQKVFSSHNCRRYWSSQFFPHLSFLCGDHMLSWLHPTPSIIFYGIAHTRANPKKKILKIKTKQRRNTSIYRKTHPPTLRLFEKSGFAIDIYRNLNYGSSLMLFITVLFPGLFFQSFWSRLSVYLSSEFLLSQYPARQATQHYHES